MRIDRLTIALIILSACKATVSTSPSVYEEDLSVHRPAFEVASIDTVKEDGVKNAEYIPLTGSIKNELDSISNLAVELNKKNNLVNGYEIQVFSGSNREKANEVKDQVNSLFPELNPKLVYRQPSFRVKAGKFTNRLKATRVYHQVKEEFPDALLVPERFKVSYD